MGYNEYNLRIEPMKITKCDDENEVMFCKVTNRATVPRPAMYEDNEDVSKVTYVAIYGLIRRKLQ
jgi:hypothetical protein